MFRLRLLQMIRMFQPLAVIALACLALTVGPASTDASAAAGPLPYCAPYHGSGIPRGSGIPPWGFHASQPFAGGRSGFSHGWGEVNLGRSWISGKICQDVYGRGQGQPGTMIAVSVGPHISYQSRVARMWGYPGNEIKTSLKVISSTDPQCKVGTRGRVVMYASYNGVRSDSMRFAFGPGCRDQNHLYHGSQVDAQVPPL
jgi:hypothetical protein